jgi:RNA polymerase sigma factor (sigma-70 family)
VSDDEILRGYLGWLRVAAGNLTGFDSPDLQDLVQEGYIAMWRALRTYNPAQGKLDYWLKFKSLNRMKTIAIRAAEHHGLHPADDEAALEVLAAPDVLEQVEIAYHDGEIAAAIDRLAPQQRRYVIARFWLGLTGNEMVTLGVFSYDPSALWNSRRNGARWKLREDLKHLALR